MSERYIPIALQALVLGQPAPVDLWNDQGMLLLARGQTIQSPEQLRRLAAHRPLVRERDHAAWQAQTGGQASLLRPDVLVQAQPSVAEALPQLSAPLLWRGLARQDTLDPVELWPRLHRVLANLLEHPQACDDFVAAVDAIGRILTRLVRQHPDDCLFLALQTMQDLTLPYSASHALWVATVAELLRQESSAVLPIDAEVVFAALTMNIGMTDLHNALALQHMPPDDQQRRRIRAHPTEGVMRLRQLGVRNDGWLRLVQNHHEAPDGSGYPNGLREQAPGPRLLSALDRLAAVASPRATRAALTPLVGLRRLFAQTDPVEHALGERLIKRLGLYPPGSYVRLANGESAVVVRHGPNARQPLVVALVNPQGIALAVPVLRYTGRPEFAVTAAVPPDAVRVRFDPARILRRS